MWRAHLDAVTVARLEHYGYADTLDVLAELLEGDMEDYQRKDKYCYFGHLLKMGKRLGLITIKEYGELENRLANWALA